MTKKRTPPTPGKAAVARPGAKSAPPAPPSAASGPKTVSLERAVRLHKLIGILAEATRTRAVLLQKLKIDIRTFYRDLELLRECGIDVELTNRKYRLKTEPAHASEVLPFPDPSLSLGEAEILAKGRTRVHQKLRALLAQIKAG